MTVREDVIRFVREELVGPRPGLPMVQLNGEEILPPQDPPRLRYGAGILFPSARPLDDQEDNAEAAEGTQTDTSSEAPAIEGVTGESDPRADARGDSQSENDLELNRTNEFLPSALGLTALVRLTGKLEVGISAAHYEKVEFPEEGYRNRTGDWISTPYWFRRPLDQRITIDDAKLLASDHFICEEPVNCGSSTSTLALHIYSRLPMSKPGQDDPRDRFVTFTLINRTTSAKTTVDESCFFQCGLEIRDAEGTACFLEYPEKRADGFESSEDLNLELLYRHRKVFAIGHGCAADWSVVDNSCVGISSSCLPAYEVAPILPTEMRSIDLGMHFLSGESDDQPMYACRKLVEEYAAWIARQTTGIERPGYLPEHLKQIATENLEACRACYKRLCRGVDILEHNSQARRAFALMNKAMLMQHIHYALSTEKKRRWERSPSGLRLEASLTIPEYSESARSWRPFQLAFILMSLRSIVLDGDADLEERKIVDLIWFPTGGGKTEAYLGLTAFTIFWRRLVDPRNSGTTALMRHTLRLLTTQQYQRASSLICACEKIRRENTVDLGVAPITIDLWVGGSVTPNSEKDALHGLGALLRGDKENPFLILSCPWCGTQMGPVKDGGSVRAKGYRKLTNPNRVRLVCEDNDCEFSRGDGLPLQLIDEHIYKEPPTLLVATVDKFAMLPWSPGARSIFGLGRQEVDPPDLIIQDELHLISGPLGSMVGLYETAIDALACRRSDNGIVPAKIVASTATIARASEQIKALYGGRESALFPPQALTAGDSFFAEERPLLRGRTYVGVFASGLPSQTTTEVRVLSSVLQAPLSLEGYDAEQLDPYWTSMVYFNSIRELGHAATLLRADIPEYLSVTWRRLGLEARWSQESAKKRRFINADMELTSRVQNSEITEYMERLFTKHPRKDSAIPVDVCLATNMIQVGLDVQRLSLMVIVGQPKTTSEYIQASSRVGRSEHGPGLVFTLLSPAKPRDRSHFEHFRAFHQSIYRYVEPTSVTPFAVPVTERALHALVVVLARYWGGENQLQYPDPPSATLQARIRAEIENRVALVEVGEKDRVRLLLDRIFNEWQRLAPDIYGSFSPDSGVVPFMYPSGTHPSEAWDGRAYSTPSSMRNVDANCQASVISVFSESESLG